MSYCLNPDCPNPKNLPQVTDCQTCGAKLLLRERYRATKILGKGGFGTTFFATDEGLPGQPDCVIKQLKPILNTPQYVAQCQKLFQREAETLGKIGSHPQIPRLLDYFELGQEFYLVQEYISGHTLHKEVKRSGPFTESQVKDVLTEVLPILDHLHQQQVIHRDIKPANIIRRAIDDKLLLIDFGVVNDQAAASNTKGSRKSDFVVGTKGFAAPEQLAKQSTYASDLYGLGMTCVFLLLGKLPKNLDTKSADLSWLNQLTVSPQFKQVLGKMLAVAVCDRYSSAQAVLQAIEQLELPVAVPPQPAPAQTRQIPAAHQPNPPYAKQTSVKVGASPTRSASPVAATPLPQKSRSVASGSTKAPSAHSEPSQKQSKPSKKSQKKSWWSLAGLGSLPAVSEQGVTRHQQAMDSMTTLINKVRKLNHQMFSNQEFIEFAQVQDHFNRSENGQSSLKQSAALLAAGIETQDIFAKLQAIESRYASAAVREIYDQVRVLLNQTPNAAAFLAALQQKVANANIAQDKNRQTLNQYLGQIETLTQNPHGFEMFSLFKSAQEYDYSVLQTASELLDAYRAGDSSVEALSRQIRIQYALFEKLGRVLGIPAQKRLPETYAQLIQYVALSDRYQGYYANFKQILTLLKQWKKHYKIIQEVRQEFDPEEYKIPKEFKQDLPGFELYKQYQACVK